MKTISPRAIWLLLSVACAALVAGSFVLTSLLDLHPCHLCIFQRLLFMKLAVLSLAAAWLTPHLSGRLAGWLTLPLAGAGIAVAGYQSWLQAQPPGSISCLAGEPGPIERLVEWLGQQVPELFLATGFCEEVELTLLGLSLAHWALLGFTAFFAAGAWALGRTRQH